MRPNETFFYVKNRRTHQDMESLTRYYLPLIGPLGLSLYAYLVSFQDDGEKGHLFSDILSYLNVGMSDFEKSLATLTAVYLVDFSQLETGHYRLVLHSPLTASSFFEHQVLANLLTRRLGETKVERLKPAPLVPAKSLNQPLSSIFRQVDSVYFKPKKALPEDFDLDHFKQLMARDNLRFDKESDDILELFRFSEKTQKTWYETYQLAKETAVGQVISTKRLFSTLQAQPVSNQAFSEAENSLIRWANRRDPIGFLADIKQARQAVVTNSERQLVKQLTQLGLLDGVINVAVFYTFQKLDSANLNEKYALKLANDLSYQKIASAEAAIIYLRGERSKSGDAKNDQVKPKAASSNVPEWSKESYRTEATPEELERLEALRRRMLGDKEVE
ncbi:DnaD domain protein [Streptococcus ovuberis]|uniref:DNA helicase n=1 Tax=Streptococcus ovuberis TaxID=1936207 RepID=A0A7X6S2A1_9STRE|nr:DnaD domain protein [Streptococcus ovuberis]NKZ21031.1 DNA helicase [Streptococcus ovuberis]